MDYKYHNDNGQRNIVRHHLENIIMLGRYEVSPIVMDRPVAPFDLQLVHPYVLHEVDDVLRCGPQMHNLLVMYFLGKHKYRTQGQANKQHCRGAQLGGQP